MDKKGKYQCPFVLDILTVTFVFLEKSYKKKSQVVEESEEVDRNESDGMLLDFFEMELRIIN